MTVDLSDALRRAVHEACAILVSEYDFVLNQEMELRYHLVSEYVEIKIGYDFNYVHTTLMMRYVNIDEEQGFIELYDVLSALIPQIPEAERYPIHAVPFDPIHRTITPLDIVVNVEVHRQVQMIVEWCKPLLCGDYSAWSKVTRYMQELHAFAFPSDGESKEDHINRLRTEASNAYQRQEYWAANRFYWKIRGAYGKLTKEDRRQMCDIKKHIFIMR